MHLLGLPDELLQEIGNYLDSQAAIACLCATNRRLYNIFLPYLFRYNSEKHAYYRTAECWAAKNGRLDVMKRVHEFGVDTTTDSVFWDTASSGSVELLDFLFSIEHPNAPSLEDLFITAADTCSIPMMQYLLDRGAVMSNALNDSGQTAIFCAGWHNNTEAIKFLLDKGANVEDRDASDGSPLACVMARMKWDAAKFLLENGADIDAKGVNGEYSVLFSAAKLGRLASVKFLLEHGADPFIKFAGGKTPLHIAAVRGNPCVVECMLEKKGTWGLSLTDDCFGLTPLQDATIASESMSADALIKSSSIDQLNHQDKNGRTAIFYAARHNRPFILRTLLEANADPNIRDRWGASPIFAGVRNEHIQVVKCLLGAVGGDCFKERDDFGHGIVWWATRCGNAEMLSLLTNFARECESDVDIEASEYFAEEKLIMYNRPYCWCDICTRSIGGLRNGYQCSSCFDLGFIVCIDCFAEGNVTCELGHREEQWVPNTACRCPVYDRA